MNLTLAANLSHCKSVMQRIFNKISLWVHSLFFSLTSSPSLPSTPSLLPFLAFPSHPLSHLPSSILPLVCLPHFSSALSLFPLPNSLSLSFSSFPFHNVLIPPSLPSSSLSLSISVSSLPPASL